MSIVTPANSMCAARWASYAVLSLLTALLLCSGVFYFDGHRVDESEVVMNAVAIAAGGWAPEWAGYGHLAMYLPAIAVAMTASFLQLTGIASSYSEGIYLLFQNDAAYRITRLLYTLADVATAVLFARLIVKATGQRLVAVCFFAYFMISPDTWLYANYIRTDTLVSLFTAIAVYALAMDRTKVTPYMVGLAIGAAVACKYSAIGYIALVFVLLIDDPARARTWKERVSTAVIATVVTIAAAFLLQPRFNFLGVISNAGIHLSGSNFTQESMPISERLARLWQLAMTVEPLALAFLLAMWFSLIRFRQGAALLIAVLVGIVPFALSNYSREYWLIPFADAVRAAGWFGVACFVALLRGRIGVDKQKWVLVGLAACTLGIVGLRMHNWREVRSDPLRELNSQAAERWLYVNAANRVPLVYSYEKNYVLPRAYSFANYNESAIFSRVFIFNRQKFESLHGLFSRRLYTKDYAEFSQSTAPAPLLLSVGSGTAARLGKNLRLCAGKHCYAPKITGCDERLQGVMGACVVYRWDMDYPELRSDLSKMSIKFSDNVSAFSLCWYSCASPSSWRIIRRNLEGEVSFLEVGDLLFAPERLMPLDKIAQSRSSARGGIIVTSPTAYVPWLKKKGLYAESDSAHEKLGSAMGAELIQRFENGTGPVIEIYKRSEPLLRSFDPVEVPIEGENVSKPQASISRASPG